MRNDRGHVGNTVVHNVLFRVDRFALRGRMRRLGAAALIDGDVNEGCTGFHTLY